MIRRVLVRAGYDAVVMGDAAVPVPMDAAFDIVAVDLDTVGVHYVTAAQIIRPALPSGYEI